MNTVPGKRIRLPRESGPRGSGLSLCREAHPRTTAAKSGATRLQFPLWESESLPQLPALGLLEGPALGRLSRAEEVLCGVNEASAEAGGGAGQERSRGCGNRPRGLREAALCLRRRAGQRVPMATAPPPRRCRTTPCSPRRVGSAHPSETPLGLPHRIPRNPAGEWSELTRGEQPSHWAQRVTHGVETHPIKQPCLGPPPTPGRWPQADRPPRLPSGWVWDVPAGE